ncbi:MAG: shikimate dehydrogenase [Lachnospiraceae bacterium]|nr:shikimate dehydrogenase [Lachnospiraceae bacterium]
MKIDINTKFVTLIGTPLAQSFAARMQNRGYEAAGLNMAYFYTEADSSHLGEIVNGLRHMNFAGFAVTKPNKVEVVKYLDELDPLCEKMGSCNTVVRTADGNLVGYNTDGLGFLRSLNEEMLKNVLADVKEASGEDLENSLDENQVKNKTYFCIGSGGAGRAICSVLAHYGAKRIYITDISEESCQSLVNDINRNFVVSKGENIDAAETEEAGGESGLVACSLRSGDFSKISECDVMINASGVGMGASVGQSPMPKEYMMPGKLYFDACYNPAKTQFLLDAEEVGGRILNGLDMSLYQGAAQIELWTGEKAHVEAMRQELMMILDEQKNNL